MARNNIFLGTGAGSVGDVTMMRRQGKQVSRLRVRTIANPKTYGQAAQRCFMAPIPKFYAPLAIALEKSWEGKNKSESYSAFLKKNVQLARKNGWTLPKGSQFFPMPYRVSNGTLPSINARYDVLNNTPCVSLNCGDSISVSSTWGVLSQRFIDMYGLHDEDQLTFVIISKVGEDIFIPYYIRTYLDITSQQYLNQFLNSLGLEYLGNENGWLCYKINSSTNPIVAGAVIASRWENDQWRRSIESMSCAPEILEAISGDGVADTNIATYMNSNTANPSDVYLNGSDE